MDFTSLLLKAHIFFGSIALTTFLLPMVTKKGGKAHTKAGWVYIFGMSGVAATAIMISVARLFFDAAADQTKKDSAVFLAMVAIFAASAVWSGMRTLKFKKRQAKHTKLIDFGFLLARLVSAVLVAAYGFHQQNWLLLLFPILPVTTGLKDLQYWMKPTEHRMHWWFHHMESMFTACIATVTAFLLTAAPRMLTVDPKAIWLWFAPTAVMVPILKVMSRHYQKKFNVGRTVL